MYDFDKVFDRRGTDCFKWDTPRRSPGQPDLLPLSVADMDFEVLPQVTQALLCRAQHPTYGYTFAGDGFYRSFLDWENDRHGLSLTQEELLAVPGTVCANALALHALTRPGDRVLLLTPVYDPFYHVIELQDRVAVTSSLVWDGQRFVLNWDDLEQKLSCGVTLLVLCSPHNPTGRVWTREELLHLDALCERYGVLVFSDEIHSDIVYPGHTHIPYPSLSAHAAQTSLLAAAPSKTFNLAGLKCCMVACKNPQLLQAVRRAMDAFHLEINTFAFSAFETAYREGGPWLDELLDYLYANLAEAHRFIQTHLPAIRSYIPDGTYLMWLDLSAYALTPQQLMDRAAEAGLVLNSGAPYGPEGDACLRLNVATQRSRLQEGLRRLYAAFGTAPTV